MKGRWGRVGYLASVISQSSNTFTTSNDPSQRRNHEVDDRPLVSAPGRGRDFARWTGLATFGDLLPRARDALPVHAPTKFALVINLKTVNALGLMIPKSLPLRADEMIESWCLCQKGRKLTLGAPGTRHPFTPAGYQDGYQGKRCRRKTTRKRSRRRKQLRKRRRTLRCRCSIFLTPPSRR